MFPVFITQYFQLPTAVIQVWRQQWGEQQLSLFLCECHMYIEVFFSLFIQNFTNKKQTMLHMKQHQQHTNKVQGGPSNTSAVWLTTDMIVKVN